MRNAVTFAAFTICSLCGVVQADIIYQFSTDRATSGTQHGYYHQYATTQVAPNVVAPTSEELDDGDVGLERFSNRHWSGFSLISPNISLELDESTFDSGYWNLTIEAEPGWQLNLDSLAFRSARGGDAGTRGYQLFAQVDGAAFAFGDTPIDSIANESGTRGNPRPVTVDLSDAMYQGIESMTFRYYPLTDNTGRSIEFDGWTITGSVVPEPTAIAMLAAGLVGLLLFRRRR